MSLSLPLDAETKTRAKQLGAVAAVGFLVYRLYQRQFRSVRGAPYARGHWLFGILPPFATALMDYTYHDWVVEQFNQYGKTFVLSLPGQPQYAVTMDPRNVEHILKTKFENYVKGSAFSGNLGDLLGAGIFVVDGERWHSQRKTASHMFTLNNFKNHIWKVIGTNCQKVVKLLQNTKPGEVVDMFNVLNRFTLDTIGSIGFGRDIGSLENPTSPFLKSFDRAQQICVLRFYLPLWRLQRFFGFGLEKETALHLKLLSDYSYETVNIIKADTTGDRADSFVGTYITEARDPDSKPDDAFLRDMVLNFLIAGRDTTAQAMSWILYLLVTHPEVEKKVVAEIKEILGDGPITFDNNPKLKYLQNVINEGLRLFPSVPIGLKIAVEDDTLPDGTFLPAGAGCAFVPYSMGRCKDLWGEDAEIFRPERWEGREFPSSCVYPVFNAGPRECLGKRLAWVEMRASLAEILRSFRFELAVPADRIKNDVALTIGMSSGLPCRVTPRR